MGLQQINTAVNDILGTQSGRPSAIPGLPTSSGQVVGAITNIFAPPGRFNRLNSIATPGFNPAADQQTEAGVVNTVSNGTTQIVAASDDAASRVSVGRLRQAQNQRLDEPTSTPSDLNDFFG